MASKPTLEEIARFQAGANVNTQHGGLNADGGLNAGFNANAGLLNQGVGRLGEPKQDPLPDAAERVEREKEIRKAMSAQAALEVGKDIGLMGGTLNRVGPKIASVTLLSMVRPPSAPNNGREFWTDILTSDRFDLREDSLGVIASCADGFTLRYYASQIRHVLYAKEDTNAGDDATPAG